jgi:quercetin dioxygenase-like cupin family protein
VRRRSFLKNAAVLPAGLKALALGQSSPDSSGSAEAHLVEAGQDRLGESHSLGFSRILFKVLPRETSGGLFLIEHKNLMKGGPPLHLHNSQEEWFYVMDGEVMFQLGDEKKLLHAGDSVLGPRGVPHAFSGLGQRPAHMLIAFTPAGKMESFFREVAVPNGPKMDADVFRRFDMEMVGPPLTA